MAADQLMAMHACIGFSNGSDHDDVADVQGVGLFVFPVRELPRCLSTMRMALTFARHSAVQGNVCQTQPMLLVEP
jgi:hypothetical protein